MNTGKLTQGDGTLTEPFPWVLNQLNHILNATSVRSLSPSAPALPPAQS